ncbi:hypothetical protein [Nocardioides cavernaquae]|uniref:Matrixin family metalloprotease n=1 Tax=Nocardioides cavernaquae TaxID=2321396 RepID=A0A3A5H9E5_9ACTN|nr:hypothetical protein [Nocardioides cavernaquae]RJS46468.1 hypothetical protein D4739_09765 [Nocardioides cavernaquae]
MSWEGRQRRKRARRLERRLRELDRVDAQHGLGTMPWQLPPARRSRTPVFVAGILIVFIAVWVGGQFATGDWRNPFTRSHDRLHPTPPIPDGDGPHAFMATQRDGRTPVTYDPCRTIRLEINPEGAPPDYRNLVEDAIEHTATATGFEFEIVGETDSRRFEQRVFGAATAPPVLVAWADADEVPELKGDVAGVGGSSHLEVRPNFRQFVTGAVILDRDVYARLASNHNRPHAQAIIDHEFGHLVGLGHVKDAGELMNADNVGQTSYGPGDLEGFARLGNVPCR